MEADPEIFGLRSFLKKMTAEAETAATPRLAPSPSAPECLAAPLEQYLERWRPLLARMTHRWTRPVGNALWISSSGSPMTMQAIYDRVVARTKAAFGKPINPHAFRDIAATTIADVDPEHVRIAAQILGHRSFATTERHYIHAKMMAATRRDQQPILRLRHSDEA